MLHQLGGKPEITPIEGVACIPQVFVVRKSLNLTTNWPVRALFSPGKVFRTIAKLPERWSDRETQALGADPGIEPGTFRMLSERSTITPQILW